MAQLTAIDPNRAGGRTTARLRPVETSLGLVPNMMRTMANAPAGLEGYLSLSGAPDTGRLSGRLREQIPFAVAEANACDYYLTAHIAPGKLAKLTGAEIIANVALNILTSYFDKAAHVVVRFPRVERV